MRRRQVAAQLKRGEAFAERVKFPRGVRDGPAPEARCPTTERCERAKGGERWALRSNELSPIIPKGVYCGPLNFPEGLPSRGDQRWADHVEPLRYRRNRRPDKSTSTEPRRTLQASALALRSWTVRQRLAAAGFGVAFALLIGIPTVLIPNPVFGRQVPVLLWNYPVWIASSILAGMLAATYVRAARGIAEARAIDDTGDAPSRLGMVGGVLAWFAVGCPVCNKLALLALGYSGAITWFAPVQPLLAAAALVTTAAALLMRLRGQTLCSTSLPVVARIRT